MLFNSYIFWAFFAVVLVLYRVLGHRGQNRMLLVASYIFYGSWDWRFLSLIVFSTAVDYWVGLALADPSASEARRKRLVTISLVSNLGLLGVFKYLGFFVESAASLLEVLGLQANLPSLRIILPVGISFYTFQTLSYTLDIYRRKLEPCRSASDFALYVAFFPQLVAGPIERASHLLPQVLTPRNTSEQQFREGLYCILFGLFKKVVIADNMALVVNQIFSQPASSLNGLDALIGVYAFAFQIYGDFHGYSLIAQGVARWLGFDVMDNFRQPYFAWSPQEFWRRWHISLSSWLRDYLYIPLGGSRGSAFKTYRNLAATMVLGGLWHGANWTFVVWGSVHGIWLGIHRAIQRREPGPGGWVARVVKVFVTFQIVCVTWLFFRADSVGQAFAFLTAFGKGFAWTPAAQLGAGLLVVFAGPMLLYEAWVDAKDDLFAVTRVAWPARAVFYFALVLALMWFSAPASSEFIYFQF
jgi:D-alanyl-lipoteichoic acid acyltransferase DltB (MBOAT superfamily)